MHHVHVYIQRKKLKNDKNQLLEKTNKMNKSLARLIERKKESTNHHCQIERKEDHPIKKIKIKYFEQLYANK